MPLRESSTHSNLNLNELTTRVWLRITLPAAAWINSVSEQRPRIFERLGWVLLGLIGLVILAATAWVFVGRLAPDNLPPGISAGSYNRGLGFTVLIGVGMGLPCVVLSIFRLVRIRRELMSGSESW